MAVGIIVKYFWYQIGSANFLYSFFSTVAANLERRKWGSVYPIIMNNLYSGHISSEQVESALKELMSIANEFKHLPVSNLVWDFEDSSKRPPWGDDINPSIKSLADYFVTSDGENLITILILAFEKAKEMNQAVEIACL